MSDQTTADIQRRTAAVKAELLRKELLSEEDVQSFLHLADEWKPENGANVVARAWTDPEFRLRLLDDGTAACAEMGYAGLQGEYIVALENTLDQHNVVVCTQCSCTAWPVLGLPPDWYKSPEYRARVVRQPRRVLSEMGLELSPDIGVRVWETSAETRYMVIPMRPSGSESMGVDELSALVTREALIGVALAAEVGRS